MHRVFLFGSRNLSEIPDVIVEHLRKIIIETNGEVEFIVGDAIGVDSGFHKALSAIGARGKGTVYCMDVARNNKFELDTKIFNTYYDEDKKVANICSPENEILEIVDKVSSIEEIRGNRAYYEFKDKQMCRDCTFAICYWDGDSKGSMKNIDRLKAQNKYVYVYTAQING